MFAQDDPVALLRAEGMAKQAWVEQKLFEHFGRESGREVAGGHSTVTPCLKVLDVGCGAGFLVRHLASLGHSVHGLDASVGSLRVSRHAETLESSKNLVRYIQGDALRLPFPDGTFDVVCSMDFLEHVEDPAAAIREAGRVLKPGGLFFFHTFNRNPLAWLVIIKGVEWFVRNTPPRMHVLRLFIKPLELADYCERGGMTPVAWTGVRPNFKKSAFWKMLGTRIVPRDFSFVLTRSLTLSYLGVAVRRRDFDGKN